MPEDRTVLDHLLEGRDALQREVARLTAAIEQLDSVLGRIGTMARRDTPIDPIDLPATPVSAGSGPVDDPVTVSAPAEPVNPPAEVEPPVAATVPARPRAVRKAPAKKGSRPRRATTSSAEPPKSIRVHVLEMLQAENRDFGLAEIIDRVHDAGIQAHDDAVRSITIKLMKDGRVERVGRGQYRLARRGSAARASAAVATAPRVTEPVTDVPAAPATAPTTPDATTYPTYAAPDNVEPETAAAEPAASEPAGPGPADPGFAAPVEDAPVGDNAVKDTAVEDTAVAEGAQDDGAQDDATVDASAADEPPAAPERGSYAPSLNLGQPWNS